MYKVQEAEGAKGHWGNGDPVTEPTAAPGQHAGL